MRLESSTTAGMLACISPCTIDWRALPEGIIALVGPIGSGKTTALETPIGALYREMPFRSAWDLATFAHDRNSYLEAIFSVEGQGQYRARVNVDGVRRVSEAVLEHTAPDGTKTLLNDGKVTTFDAAVAQHFPAKAVLLASTFSCQKKEVGSLSRQDRKDRKTVIGQMIGLDHLEAMAQTAKAAAGLCETTKGRLAVVRDVLARDVTPELCARLETSAAGLRLDLATSEQLRDAAQQAIDALTAEQDALRGAVTRHAQAVERRNTVSAEIAWRTKAHEDARTALAALGDVLRAEHRAASDGLEVALAGIARRRDESAETLGHDLRAIDVMTAKAIADLEQRLAHDVALVNDLEAANRTRTKALADLDERIANNQKLLEQAPAIRADAHAATETDAALVKWRAHEIALRDHVKPLQAEYDRLLGDLHAIDLARNHLEHAQESTKLLGTVPCGGQAEYAGCQFLTNATAAKARIAGLQAQVDEGAGLVARRTEVDRQLVALRQEGEILAEQIRTLERTAKDLAPKVKLLPTLETAEARLADLTLQRTAAETAANQERDAAERRSETRRADLVVRRLEAEAQAETQRQDAERRHGCRLSDLDRQVEDARLLAAHQRDAAQERHDTRHVELSAAVTEQGDRLARLAGHLSAADRDMAADADAVTRLPVIDATLQTTRNQAIDANAAVIRIDADLRQVTLQLTDFDARQRNLTDLEARLRTVDAELVEWQLLARALGRDGLQTLEIDAAGPLVSSYANDLMSACFGPRFSLELVTQQAKVGGKGMRETCEILVTDNQRGGCARDLGMISGGEQAMVEECLRNALALYANTRSATPVRTLFRDEDDAPLDDAGAANYVPMLRRLRQMGGYHQILIVSHRPIVADMADAQLRFSDGKATIALPPYAAA